MKIKFFFAYAWAHIYQLKCVDQSGEVGKSQENLIMRNSCNNMLKHILSVKHNNVSLQPPTKHADLSFNRLNKIPPTYESSRQFSSPQRGNISFLKHIIFHLLKLQRDI